MEITTGVYLVEAVRGSNVYLLVNSELALIDTGMPGNADRILNFIKDLRDPQELAYIIVTHGHVDHTGSVAELRCLTGAKVVAHRDEATLTAEGKYALSPHRERVLGDALLRVLTSFEMLKPSPVDLLVTDGDVLPYPDGLRIVHTPGHTRGSICLLLETSKVLFVGDTIINNEDRLSRPLPFGADRHESGQSVRKLVRLNFDVCCFGHGSPLCWAQEKVNELAMNYPSTPLYWRVTRNWRQLIRFGLRLWRRD